jgi:putative oxidoreductase
MQQKAATLARWALGLLFVVFGLNGFLRFFPVPPARPAAERLIGALIETNYFFPMIKAFEVLTGLLLLSNRLVPLALTLLAPILLGITSIHLFLNPEGLPLMAVLVALHAYLVSRNWGHFRDVLAVRPAAAPSRQR